LPVPNRRWVLQHSVPTHPQHRQRDHVQHSSRQNWHLADCHGALSTEWIHSSRVAPRGTPFFGDGSHQRFPQANLNLIDMTDENNPPALDCCFLDADIEDFVKLDIDESTLDGHFFENCPEFTRNCWSGAHNSEFASRLGIPRSNTGRLRNHSPSNQP